MSASPRSILAQARYSSSRAAAVRVSMSASLNWMPWNCAMGCPNWRRSRVGRGVVGRALGDPDGLRGDAEARAVECAERDAHALARLADQVLGGTRTSSKIGWPVGDPLMPSLCSSLPTEKPGRSASTMKAAIPRERPRLRVGLGEDDVEVGDAEIGDPVLRPGDHPLAAVADGARDHPARVEPASGSESAKPGDHSPDAHLGRKRCFSSSVPKSRIGSVPAPGSSG